MELISSMSDILVEYISLPDLTERVTEHLLEKLRTEIVTTTMMFGVSFQNTL